MENNIFAAVLFFLLPNVLLPIQYCHSNMLMMINFIYYICVKLMYNSGNFSNMPSYTNKIFFSYKGSCALDSPSF